MSNQEKIISSFVMCITGFLTIALCIFGYRDYILQETGKMFTEIFLAVLFLIIFDVAFLYYSIRKFSR